MWFVVCSSPSSLLLRFTTKSTTIFYKQPMVLFVVSRKVIGIPTSNLCFYLKPFFVIKLDGVQYFLGVPFAASPVGQLRWRPPTPPTAWSTPIDGTQHRSMCLQGGFIGLDGSEGFRKSLSRLCVICVNVASYLVDCLYLDIYMPVNVTTPLSIMIWIYGGGFNNGDKYFGQ
jgi:hypothetical protein